MATNFMNLDLPTVSVTLGPEWATEINAALTTIDEHDHTSGKGTQIPASGLNINTDLNIQSNNLTNVVALNYDISGSTLTGASNANKTYVFNGDLYYTNSSGITVQLTSGGSIVSSPGALQTAEVQAVSSNLIISPSDTFVFLTVDTTSSRTITLPLANSVVEGRIYILKDSSGLSNSNPIALTPAGSDTIDGVAAAYTLNSNLGSWWVVGDGTSAWHVA